MRERRREGETIITSAQQTLALAPTSVGRSLSRTMFSPFRVAASRACALLSPRVSVRSASALERSVSGPASPFSGSAASLFSARALAAAPVSAAPLSTKVDPASVVVDPSLTWSRRAEEANIGQAIRKDRYPARNQLDLQEINVRKLHMKGSVQKANHLARLVRKLMVPDALVQLRYCRKQRSGEFMQMIKEGVKYAEEKHGLPAEKLQVAIVNLGRGPFLKRVDFKGRGRTGVIRIPSTHVHIVLREKPTSAHYEKLAAQRRSPGEVPPPRTVPDIDIPAIGAKE